MVNKGSLKIIVVSLILSSSLLYSLEKAEARRIKASDPSVVLVQNYPRLNVPVNQYIGLFNIGKFLGNPNEIPRDIVAKIKDALASAQKEGLINGFKVTPVSKDVLVHVSTYQKGVFNLDVYELMRKAVIGGLTYAKDTGKLVDASILGQDPLTQLKRLQLRSREFGLTPRQAEPNGMIILEGSAPGAANFVLDQIYADPTSNAGSIIDPKMAPDGFIFEISDLKDYKIIEGRKYYKTYSLRTKTQRPEILAMISDPHRFVVTQVKKSGPDGKPVSEEPVAVVTTNYFGDETEVSGSFNTLIMFKAQSGIPAVGEYLNPFRNAMLVPAGTLKSGMAPYYRPIFPVGLEELSSGSSANFVRVGVYGFPLSREGAIPQTTIDSSTGMPAFSAIREEATILAEFLERMRGFIPDLNPNYADERAREMFFERYAERVEEVPASEPTGKGENTVSAIKADIGSVFGHIGIPDEFKAETAIVLESARTGGTFRIREYVKKIKDEKTGKKIPTPLVEPVLKDGEKLGLFTYKQVGVEEVVVEGKKEKWPIFEVKYNAPLINDYKIFNAGDDTELLMFHNKGIDAPEIHRYVALLAFLKGTGYAFDHGYYAAGQDLLTDAPSGNVRGAGPGVAEMVIGSNNEPLDIVAMDKTSPMAYNVLVTEMLDRALERNPDANYNVEIWWLEEGATKRASFDARTEMLAIKTILASYDHAAVKRIKDNRGNVVAVFSTDKLALTAGEYVGKDDPVAIFVHSFAKLGGLTDSFTRPWMVEGGMRGSHRMVLIPSDLAHGHPSLNDAPPIAVGAQVTFVSQEGKIVGFDKGRTEFSNDLFAGEVWAQIRNKSSQLNILWMRQGPYDPYRLTGERAEYTTLGEVLKKLAQDPTARYMPLPQTVVEYLMGLGKP
ncbi:MAG: fructose 1,6-bisphosphatase [Candidatus Omnitrophica bacterium]|nr:fructose 1,6-bisphosphatase [Candidatus Omnitrophota bacterium]